MIFLPVAERELRVASRKRSTAWIRVVGALIGLLIGAGFLIIGSVSPRTFSGVSFGRALFSTLSWMTFAAALGAGLFLTADCVSEEKREGTLGLLFLTDLRGLDVVMGKFLASSLRAFYGLLAVFPILAISIVMGGVTGQYFWKGILALTLTMLLSLGAGQFTSVISRDSHRAMMGTLFLLLLIVAGAPLLDLLLGVLWRSAPIPLANFINPGYLLASADDIAAANYWRACAGNLVVILLFFVGASFLIPRMWQDNRRSEGAAGWQHRWRFGHGPKRVRLRNRLLGANPMLWLVLRERWQASALWVLTFLYLAGLIAMLIFGDDEAGWIIGSQFGGVFVLVLYFVASQSGRFFVEAKRSGLLELMLSTPLSIGQILRGQWHGWLRRFGLPMLLIALGQGFVTWQSHSTIWRVSRRATTATSAPTFATTNRTGAVATNTVVWTVKGTTASSSSTWMNEPDDVIMLVSSIATALMASVTIVLNIAALFWFGLWCGLSAKRAATASLATFGFVQIIPYLVVSFVTMIGSALAMGILMAAAGGPGITFYAWYQLAMAMAAGALYLVKDLIFLIWARRRLSSELRSRAANLPRPKKVQKPPPALPPLLPDNAAPAGA